MVPEQSGSVGSAGMDDLLQALNSLLEAERAGVEALVGLSMLSTDLLERETLQRIGGEEAWACASLRGLIETLGGIPSQHISPLLMQVHTREQFAEGLRAFCWQQRGVLGHLESLLAGPLPDAVRALLVELHRVHLPNIAWCEEHATFAAAGDLTASSVAEAGGKRKRDSDHNGAVRRVPARQGGSGRAQGGGNHAGRSRRSRLPDTGSDGAPRQP